MKQETVIVGTAAIACILAARLGNTYQSTVRRLIEAKKLKAAKMPGIRSPYRATLSELDRFCDATLKGGSDD